MIYLSLFNGISASRLATERAGLSFEKYYVAEIYKWANKVSESHYPDNIQLGDVTKWRKWDIDWSQVSLVTAGFPCQAWSMTGKQMGDKDPRGALFWTTLEIIGNVLKHNPNAKYMLENVKMKKEFEEYITHHTEQALGDVTKTLINSALVSAQNRNRYYWTNFTVEQPEDKGILLRQIIEDGENQRCKSQTILSTIYKENSKSMIKRGKFGLLVGYVDREKSYCIDANYFKGSNPDQYFNKSHRQLVFGSEIYQRGRGFNKEGVFYDKSPTLTSCSWYRKLTPTECARLQTFPDSWCESVVSNTQAYKCYGNAWTVDVIAHIFEEMKK